MGGAIRILFKSEALMKIIKTKLTWGLLFFVCVVVAVSSLYPAIVSAETKTKEKINDTAVGSEEKNSYRIGVGDILQITTWKEPDFSREQVLVRLDGKISFPLLDDIKAAGRTTYELKRNITSLLKRYLDSPNVTISIREPNSQKFYVLGEVMRTGEYPLLKEMTIMQAFAVAGGFTQWASKKEIVLIRKGEDGKDSVIKIDYRKLAQGSSLDKNIILQANDTIIVP
jgi:polysaccharide export outer membrane protein